MSWAVGIRWAAQAVLRWWAWGIGGRTPTYDTGTVVNNASITGDPVRVWADDSDATYADLPAYDNSGGTGRVRFIQLAGAVSRHPDETGQSPPVPLAPGFAWPKLRLAELPQGGATAFIPAFWVGLRREVLVNGVWTQDWEGAAYNEMFSTGTQSWVVNPGDFVMNGPTVTSPFAANVANLTEPDMRYELFVQLDGLDAGELRDGLRVFEAELESRDYIWQWAQYYFGCFNAHRRNKDFSAYSGTQHGGTYFKNGTFADDLYGALSDNENSTTNDGYVWPYLADTAPSSSYDEIAMVTGYAGVQRGDGLHRNHPNDEGYRTIFDLRNFDAATGPGNGSRIGFFAKIEATLAAGETIQYFVCGLRVVDNETGAVTQWTQLRSRTVSGTFLFLQSMVTDYSSGYYAQNPSIPPTIYYLLATKADGTPKFTVMPFIRPVDTSSGDSIKTGEFKVYTMGVYTDTWRKTYVDDDAYIATNA